ncbi:hypothetical protein INR49_032929, partial [Caranx melampygus]
MTHQTQATRLERGLILARNLQSAARGPDPVPSGTRSGKQRCLGLGQEEEEVEE